MKLGSKWPLLLLPCSSKPSLNNLLHKNKIMDKNNTTMQFTHPIATTRLNNIRQTADSIQYLGQDEDIHSSNKYIGSSFICFMLFP
jgi:hypothetical protein